MIDKEKAIEIVRQNLAEGLAVMLDATIELEHGWLVFCQTSEFVETGDEMKAGFGIGYWLVEKESGRRYHLDPGVPVELNLKIYELGYLEYENWDIIITGIRNMDETIGSLMRLRPQIVIPEEAYGTTWRIPRPYTATEIAVLLASLPCRINLGVIYPGFDWRILEDFKQQDHFDYYLHGNVGFENHL